MRSTLATQRDTFALTGDIDENNLSYPATAEFQPPRAGRHGAVSSVSIFQMKSLVAFISHFLHLLKNVTCVLPSVIRPGRWKCQPVLLSSANLKYCQLGLRTKPLCFLGAEISWIDGFF